MNMITRTIMIFPEFHNMEVINFYRNKYDPLSDLVKPHITLVFPFQSGISNDELNCRIKLAWKVSLFLCSLLITW